jgi:hypothetical protein
LVHFVIQLCPSDSKAQVQLTSGVYNGVCIHSLGGMLRRTSLTWQRPSTTWENSKWNWTLRSVHSMCHQENYSGIWSPIMALTLTQRRCRLSLKWCRPGASMMCRSWQDVWPLWAGSSLDSASGDSLSLSSSRNRTSFSGLRTRKRPSKTWRCIWQPHTLW